MPITSPHDPAIQAIASELAHDKSVVQSIRRYSGDSLVWFGRYTAPSGAILEGGSNRTAAYRTIAALVRPLVSRPHSSSDLVGRESETKRSARSAPATSSYAPIPETPPSPSQRPTGCLGMLVVLFMVAGAASVGSAWVAHLI